MGGAVLGCGSGKSGMSQAEAQVSARTQPKHFRISYSQESQAFTTDTLALGKFHIQNETTEQSP